MFLSQVMLKEVLQQKEHGIAIVKVKFTQSYSTLWDSMGCSPPGSSDPSKKIGVGSLFLLQAIFPTQGSNPALPHCRWILYQLSHKGSPLSHQGYPNFKNWNNNPNAYWASIMCSELCIDCFIYMHWHLVDVSSGWTKSKDLCPYGVYFLLWDIGIKQIITRIHI